MLLTAKSKREWQFIEKQLDCLWHTVTLDCDGYKVTLILERYTQLKNTINVYINKEFRGSWRVNDCEERRRFLCKKERYFYSKKDRDHWNKTKRRFGKKFLEKLGIKPDVKYVWYTPSWNSFRALKRHLLKNNKQIRLITPKMPDPVEVCNG